LFAVLAVATVNAVTNVDPTGSYIDNLPFAAEARQVVNDLTKEVAESTLLHHDFLQCYSQGGYKDMNVATRLFAINHYSYSRNFLKYLNAVKEKLSIASPEDTHLITENVAEELGNYEEDDLVTMEKAGVARDLIAKKPHTVLIRHFLEKVNARPEDLDDKTTIGAKFTADILDMYAEANACEALAIIGFAIEQTVPSLYQFILDGLKNHTTMDPTDFVFFPLHNLVVDGHADHLKAAFTALYARNKDQCSGAVNTVRKVLARRSKMLSDLKVHVEEQTGGQICSQGNDHTSYIDTLPHAAEARQVVKDLSAEVAASNLLHHEFLQCFSEGGYKDMQVATRLFAINHYSYSRNFLKYLNSVKEKLAQASPEDTHLITENVAEELGNYEDDDLETMERAGVARELIAKKPHTVLIRHFLDVVGATPADLDDKTTIGAKFTADILDMYDKANACEALAIIGFAIEQTVPTLYQFIWDGLKNHTTMNPNDFVFFPLHILVDDGHADHLKDAFTALYARGKDQCANAAETVRTVLNRRSKMLSDLKAHVEEVTGGQICSHSEGVAQVSGSM
jgi:pyrroloquinoline quinone (PQQ) biosynthesis protein C